ncbi:hypothetical protein QTP70_022161 [Hemibagrus guttatus]|uniref:Uncharacterized protein n=1 Tax=Hemibagrus guttatus TaxID=175788 RepID=A0AAE0V6X7_9TELE|nr:hypothetical protein QTP70_022161 [Hemibagrus guttatus]
MTGKLYPFNGVCSRSFIHSLSTAYPIYSHEEPVPISGVIGHQGRIHPGWSANPSQHTHTHTLNLETPINLPHMSLDLGRKPEYPKETPEARGEHANSTHTVEAGIEPPTLEVGGKHANR